MKPESLRYLLGVKIRSHRQARDLGLKELARKTGLSVSYLSEIEKGRKYPKPEKILLLAEALGVSFDELVSLKVGEDLAPARDLMSSPFIREFPFHLFGLELESVLGLVVEAPPTARALLNTAIEIGRTYGIRVEHFLLAALRSYQQLHKNHFEEIEAAAAAAAADHDWAKPGGPDAEELRAILQEEHGVRVDDQGLDAYPSLSGLRSVWIDGAEPVVLLNRRLLESQKAFVLGRELGYQRLGLSERSTSSSPLKVESFDQVINDFKAAYFSGALILPRDLLRADLATLFGRKRFAPGEFLGFLDRYRTTPETFFYRLSQVIPQCFGLKELFFVRWSHAPGSGEFRLTKHLNMSRIPITRALNTEEHYCRRWTGLRLLTALAAGKSPAGGTVRTAEGLDVSVLAQRSLFLDADEDFFVVSLARPLALAGGVNTSVSLGFLVDRACKRQVRFWNDPALRQVEVNLTCESCPLAPAECTERAAPPRLVEAAALEAGREADLQRLVEAFSDP